MSIPVQYNHSSVQTIHVHEKPNNVKHSNTKSSIYSARCTTKKNWTTSLESSQTGQTSAEWILVWLLNVAVLKAEFKEFSHFVKSEGTRRCMKSPELISVISIWQVYASAEHTLTLQAVREEREAHRAAMPPHPLCCPFRETFVFCELVFWKASVIG